MKQSKKLNLLIEKLEYMSNSKVILKEDFSFQSRNVKGREEEAIKIKIAKEKFKKLDREQKINIIIDKINLEVPKINTFLDYKRMWEIANGIDISISAYNILKKFYSEVKIKRKPFFGIKLDYKTNLKYFSSMSKKILFLEKTYNIKWENFYTIISWDRQVNFYLEGIDQNNEKIYMKKDSNEYNGYTSLLNSKTSVKLTDALKNIQETKDKFKFF